MRLNTQGLQFVLCSGRFPQERDILIYKQIYDGWHSLWSATYAELNGQNILYSDTFTRQDIVGSIFLDGQCQAFILFRHIDISHPAALNDSYFEHWGEVHIQKISSRGPHILICGNLGILPEARQESLGFSMKHLMMGLITEIALHSAADAVISTPRNDKGVNSAVYKWGGVSIGKDVQWGLDVVVDLTAFFKDELRKNRSHEMVPLVEKLWEERTVLPENMFESVNAFLPASQNPHLSRKVA